MLVQKLAKGLTSWISHSFDHSVESVLGCADGAHAVVDAAWSKHNIVVDINEEVRDVPGEETAYPSRP